MATMTQIAEHEAAHAVVALVLGVDVIEVCLAPHDLPGRGGACRYATPGSLDDDLTITLAAGATDRLLGTAVMDADDRATAWRLLDAWTPQAATEGEQQRQRYARLQTAARRADNLVRLHRNAIVKVRQALLERGRLTGSEVASVAGIVVIDPIFLGAAAMASALLSARVLRRVTVDADESVFDCSPNVPPLIRDAAESAGRAAQHGIGVTDAHRRLARALERKASLDAAEVRTLVA